MPTEKKARSRPSSDGGSAPANLDPVTAYAQDVVAGRIPAGLLVRLACQRHLDDLKHAGRRGLRWDLDQALYALEFFRFLRHSKGEWAGVEFVLSPWQKFVVGSLWGWRRRDGTRRFRVAYIEVPRKNGKSTLAAGVGLLLFVADGEPGAEVYSAATKRDQAKIVWGEAARMVKASPALRKRIRVLDGAANMHIEAVAAKFEPLGADKDTLDGLNVHGAIIDELHAHKTRGVWDVLDTATGARRQPLVLAITTAGTDRESVCREQHDYSEAVLRGTVQDNSWFGYIACADEGDRWDDQATWAKANPNLGVSVKVADLERKAAKAKESPASLNAFLRLHLNIWTQQVNRWIDLDVWDENAGIVAEDKLLGRPCYGGLDLSSVSDLTAWVMVFPGEDDPERIDVLARFWCPEARVHDPRNRYHEQYQAWVRDGWLTATPGDAIDYSFIRRQINEDANRFGLIDLNVDRYFEAHQIAMDLEADSLKVAMFGMGMVSMAGPMKEFERRLLLRKINHGGHPVLRWMADGVAVKQDAAGNVKPDKAGSQCKIDGIVALVMALDRAMRHEDGGSVYDERGVLTV